LQSLAMVGTARDERKCGMRTHRSLWLTAAFVSFSFTAGVEASPPAAEPMASNKAAPDLVARVRPAMRPLASATPAPTAQPKPAGPKLSPAQAAAARATQMAAAKANLESAEPDAVEQAFSSLAELGGPDALKLVVARVRRGLPPQLVDPALTALVVFRQPSTTPLLLELSQHRRWQVRQKAIETLGALGAKSAQSSLLYALDDPSTDVRAAAVQALGLVGDARALPALTLAMERGVEGAALALGRLGSAKEAELLLARARGEALTVVEPGLHAMVLRANLGLPTKLRIIQELSKLPAPEARAYLDAWAQAPEGLDPRLRQALGASSTPQANVVMAAKTAAASAGDKP